jgi:Flp pilus assembly protein TadG
MFDCAFRFIGRAKLFFQQSSICVAGAAAVEFALTAPILVVLALGVADYGALMTNLASLQGATRALAEYARGSAACAGGGLSNSNCVTGMNYLVSTLQSNDTSLSSASFSYPTADLSAAGANYCTCVDGNVVSCSSGTCNVSGDTRRVEYIQVTATQSISPVLAPLPFGFPSSVSGQTTIPIQIQ